MSATAARTQEGSIAIALVNTSLDEAQQVDISIEGAKPTTAAGRILTCRDIADHNDFAHPHTVEPKMFGGAKLKGQKLTVDLPPRSIVVLDVK